MIVGERVNNILYSCVRFLAITKSSNPVRSFDICRRRFKAYFLTMRSIL